MNALFVLLPAGTDLEALLTPLAASPAAAAPRRYPRADDAAHLHSLVRSSRDPIATTWRRGAMRAVLAGALLGGLTNGLLCGGFGMLGGLLTIAIPLGLGVGAFLGGFTAAMVGTEVPRDELRPLLRQARAGDTLLQWSGTEPTARAALTALAAACEQAGLAHTMLRD